MPTPGKIGASQLSSPVPPPLGGGGGAPATGLLKKQTPGAGLSLSGAAAEPKQKAGGAPSRGMLSMLDLPSLPGVKQTGSAPSQLPRAPLQQQQQPKRMDDLGSESGSFGDDFEEEAVDSLNLSDSQ
eukprot:TRINITY_DN10686_c0_g1_i1.p3 TRINITY_DN10686_c0_g1~~TRINITY_DN10686_c0_g1_i1.p3  ORF type:complete len:127 (-),score=37.49 TRINITY_DN10686_c0_g1_i1:51-431(-)